MTSRLVHWAGVLSMLTPLAAGAAQDGSPAILERDPRSLLTAEEGRWEEWHAATPPPAAAREELLNAVRAYSNGLLIESLEWLYAALDRVPDFPAALHQLGVVYFRLRRYSDAVEAFERFLARAPGEVGMTRALGHAYYSLGRYEDALVHYRRVLEVRPKMVEALRGYALTHLRLGDPEEALVLLDRVLELDPAHADARTWRAQVLFDEERLEDALEEALRARDQDPHEPRPWFLLSQIHFDLGHEEEGEEARSRFLALDRVDQELRVLEGRLLLEPRQPQLVQRVVWLHRELGDVRRTRASLRRLCALERDSFESQVFALDVLEGMGDGPGAAAAAAALEARHPEVPETWKRLQEYFGRIGERMKQVQAAERYLRLQTEPE